MAQACIVVCATRAIPTRLKTLSTVKRERGVSLRAKKRQKKKNTPGELVCPVWLVVWDVNTKTNVNFQVMGTAQ